MELNMKEASQLVIFEKIKDGLLTKTATAKFLLQHPIDAKKVQAEKFLC